ncbi:MAG: hypothetical protein EPN82_15645 [Bacteroidetes bacterium]|nr:MAG: hypothetical protein EPN82_15645 [Bacteroidota bacterium]
MRKALLSILVFLFCIFWLNNALSLNTVNQCLVCHESNGDKPAMLFKKDIHYKMGITCADCHGGNSKSDDMEIAMNKRAGFIGIPKGDDISGMCAKCHSNPDVMKRYHSELPTNQLEMLKTSVHGKLSITGKENLLQCITCHNAHGIVPVKDKASPVHPSNVINTCGSCHSNAKFMRAYNPALPIDQAEKYRTSVHGILHAKGDSKVAVCTSCHGSHDIRQKSDLKSKVYKTNLPSTCSVCHSNSEYMKEYKIPTNQYDKYTHSVHGIALFEKHDISAPVCNDCHGNHGATPPGLESISKVCGTCHAMNADLFSSSPHKKAFDEHKYPECETCHGNHEIITATDQLLGVDKNAVCSRCHSESQNTKGFKVAKNMRMLIDKLEKAEKRAIDLVHEAEQKGMEISEAKYKLKDAHQARLEARTMVHSFNLGKFQNVVNTGLVTTSEITSEAGLAVKDYYYRRYGLGIASLIITILVISLYKIIRRIEKKQKS